MRLHGCLPWLVCGVLLALGSARADPVDCRRQQSNPVLFPPFGIVGEPVVVRYSSDDPNGCYRQSNVRTTVEHDTILHAYETWMEGEICTDAIRKGGFTTSVSFTSPGVRRGVVNGGHGGSYTLEVFATRDEVRDNLRRALPSLQGEELTRAVKFVPWLSDEQLELALVDRLDEEWLKQPDNHCLVEDWLRNTAYPSVTLRARSWLTATAREWKLPMPDSADEQTLAQKEDRQLGGLLFGLSCHTSRTFVGIDVARLALKERRSALCESLGEVAKNLRDCPGWNMAFDALLGMRSPACDEVARKLLDTLDPDVVSLRALEPRASEEPFRSIVLRRAADWQRFLPHGRYLEHERMLVERVVRAAQEGRPEPVKPPAQ